MKKLLCFGFAILMVSLSIAQRTLIYCGQMVDVKNLQVLKEMTIAIEGNIIVDVIKGYLAANPGDKIIDLKSKTVMPGLIDMHVHLEGETNPGQYMETFTFNPADYAFQSVVFAESTLMT